MGRHNVALIVIGLLQLAALLWIGVNVHNAASARCEDWIIRDKSNCVNDPDAEGARAYRELLREVEKEAR